MKIRRTAKHLKTYGELRTPYMAVGARPKGIYESHRHWRKKLLRRKAC